LARSWLRWWLGLLFLVYRTFPQTGVATRAAAALFALQNGSPITLRFLVWAAHDVPLAGTVLLAWPREPSSSACPFR